MARIIAAVKAKGVADADLASQWVSLQPQYDYSSSGTVPPRVIGFQANQSLSIKVHKIETSGDVIDAAVGAVEGVAGRVLTALGVAVLVIVYRQGRDVISA